MLIGTVAPNFDLGKHGGGNGKLVRTIIDAPFAKGSFKATWNSTDNTGNNMASGVYFSRLIGDGISKVNQLLLIKQCLSIKSHFGVILSEVQRSEESTESMGSFSPLRFAQDDIQQVSLNFDQVMSLWSGTN